MNQKQKIRKIYEDKDGKTIVAFFKDGESNVFYQHELGCASLQAKKYWSQTTRLQGWKLISREVIS